MSYEQTNGLCVYCSERISIPSWDQLQWIQAQAEHVKVCAPKIRAELTSAQEKLKVAEEAFDLLVNGPAPIGGAYLGWAIRIARTALAKIRGDT